MTISRTLGKPTNAKCGQRFTFRILNPSTTENAEITLDSAFRNGLAYPLHADGSPAEFGLKIVSDNASPAALWIVLEPGSGCYLEVIYDAVDDRFDIIEFIYYQNPVESFPPAWAYWKFEEASGNRADSTGNGHTLSETGGTIGSTTGKLGNAAAFDNASEYLSLASNTLWDPSGDTHFLYALWLKRAAASGYIVST